MSEKKQTKSENTFNQTVSSEEEEIRKKAIFDSMSPRRQKHILKKGYSQWNPFLEPKDPLDIRKDSTQRTTQQLIRDFLQSRNFSEYSNEYGRGAFDLCLGLINNDQRYQGMYDFSCWYQQQFKQEIK